MRPVTDLRRRARPFEVISPYTPGGDQPAAIDELERRLERLERRGLERAEAMARMAGQADDEARRALADVVLVNNGTEADLADGVAWLWDNRLAPLRRLGAAGRPA